jgi:hypothetical protein
MNNRIVGRPFEHPGHCVIATESWVDFDGNPCPVTSVFSSPDIAGVVIIEKIIDSNAQFADFRSKVTVPIYN